MQGLLLQVDVAEIVLHEACDPDAIVDFLDADALTGDYVLSDVMMPGLDGAELYEALRARGDTTCFIPVTSIPLDRLRALCPM